MKTVGLIFKNETAPRLEKMSTAELRAYAESAGIELPDGMKKAELLALITEAANAGKEA